VRALGWARVGLGLGSGVDCVGCLGCRGGCFLGCERGFGGR
jgi:hypothetical protein